MFARFRVTAPLRCALLRWPRLPLPDVAAIGSVHAVPGKSTSPARLRRVKAMRCSPPGTRRIGASPFSLEAKIVVSNEPVQRALREDFRLLLPKLEPVARDLDCGRAGAGASSPKVPTRIASDGLRRPVLCVRWHWMLPHSLDTRALRQPLAGRKLRYVNASSTVIMRPLPRHFSMFEAEAGQARSPCH